MKTFKIQSGPLNCNLEKVLYLLYLLKFKRYGEAPCIGEARTKFRYRFNNYKTNLVLSGNEIEKIPQPRLHNHSCLDCHLGTDDWDFILFRQCRAYKQLKETKTFWQLRLKTFSLLGLNEKEEYLH